MPVTLRRNMIAENWQKLKTFDFYLVPASEDMEMEVEYMTNNDTVDQGEDEESPQGHGNPSNTNDGRPLLDQESNDSTPVIPEAYLVEENNDNIVDAEPLLPWWKQTRTVFSVICLMMTAAAIAVGLTVTMGRAAAGEMQPITLSPAPSSTVAPSASPTTCFSVDIAVTLFHNSTEHAWKLLRMNNVGEGDAIRSYEGEHDGDTSHSESMCLPEGEYEFTINFDSEEGGGGGMCCAGEYNITSNGQLIAQGKEFWQHSLAVTSRFSIP